MNAPRGSNRLEVAIVLTIWALVAVTLCCSVRELRKRRRTRAEVTVPNHPVSRATGPAGVAI